MGIFDNNDDNNAEEEEEGETIENDGEINENNNFNDGNENVRDSGDCDGVNDPIKRIPYCKIKKTLLNLRSLCFEKNLLLHSDHIVSVESLNFKLNGKNIAKSLQSILNHHHYRFHHLRHNRHHHQQQQQQRILNFIDAIPSHNQTNDVVDNHSDFLVSNSLRNTENAFDTGLAFTITSESNFDPSPRISSPSASSALSTSKIFPTLLSTTIESIEFSKSNSTFHLINDDDNGDVATTVQNSTTISQSKILSRFFHPDIVLVFIMIIFYAMFVLFIVIIVIRIILTICSKTKPQSISMINSFRFDSTTMDDDGQSGDDDYDATSNTYNQRTYSQGTSVLDPEQSKSNSINQSYSYGNNNHSNHSNQNNTSNNQSNENKISDSNDLSHRKRSPLFRATRIDQMKMNFSSNSFLNQEDSRSSQQHHHRNQQDLQQNRMESEVISMNDLMMANGNGNRSSSNGTII